jgi:acetylornithine/succinylornithine aminotransferase
MGALALTHKAAYREPFEPLPGGVEFIPAGDIEALRGALGPDVAALIVEPIQGEAGVRELPAGYLEAARELTEAVGALLIIDEVQSGMGRSGAWMAHHLLAPGVVPDVVTLAKGLGGGIPIGAVVATGEAAALLGPGQHGTTFGGNPVACAAALAVIDTVRSQDLLVRVEQLGSAWARELAAVDGVNEVRGRGLLIGVGLAEGLPPAGEIAATLLAERGFIVNAPRPDTIRLAPPFILSDDDAGAFTTALSEILSRAQSEKVSS